MAYDPLSYVGGVAHVVLPDSTGRKDLDLPGRYMDLAIPALIKELINAGANRSRLKFVAVGGANVFKFGAGAASLNLSIGERNIQALHENLTKHNARLEADLIGGTQATSTQLCLGSGEVFVACGSREMNLLHKFGEGQHVRAA
ncbi:MAG: chemotaxis protein CheD [Armatimonadota bacterium]